MKVVLAKTAGFCMGVGLALKKLDSLVREKVRGDKPGQGQILTLGPIIHNPQVLEEYEALGVLRIDAPEQAPPGSTVVIRAHGIPRDKEEELRQRGVGVVDATCPKVKKAQLLIAEQAGNGRVLLLYGEENHPEVRGLLSYADNGSEVFDSLEGLASVLRPGGKYFLAAQTTQDKALFQDIKEYLSRHADPETPILETICDATRVRQREAVAIARQVDKMVVAGGFISGNTRRLVKVVEDQGVLCVHVETADQLRPEDFSGCKIIGLTAGASTPDKIIEKVYSTLESF
ncbi:MAG: 4-hydroxy-3-methylbut-2-enyl diphosphate reductase [Thermodesulfobacteriota bacterium]|nr:4-hydroxy-3-methylbut-2-enyl diphosphate reductase [Thermodesulfobacteriota bacterium]